MKISNYALRIVKQWLGLPLAAAMVIFAMGCERHESAGVYVDDEATSGRVQKALRTDNAYTYPDVKVSSSQGTVQLAGFVDNAPQKDRAAEIAKNISGVRKVENKIVVK